MCDDQVKPKPKMQASVLTYVRKITLQQLFIELSTTRSPASQYALDVISNAYPDWQQTAHDRFAQPARTFDDLLEMLQATEVKCPSNGHCMYYALLAIKMNSLGGGSEVITPRRAKDAADHRQQVYSHPRFAVLNQPSDRNTSRLDIHSKWTDEVALTQLTEHLINSGNLDVTEDVGSLHWAGIHEMMATAIYFREPIYVLDRSSSETPIITVYYPIQVKTPSAKTVEAVRVLP
ncbi:TPA: LOW QUALITY PROTEIN: hypothetical protein N0F65_004090 [Lagenidium giganteum]|uniref:OTU domain-containing protein n=1 Tax=Lagenidium giganteum TaxID=4803 RepID=A0AAV2YWJ1_9STRA|nr:TPA: LOW QUALITY PROTEIN: hypothetical protein N0F65_004090 [Lagenidium giganteum]